MLKLEDKQMQMGISPTDIKKLEGKKRLLDWK